MFRCRLLLSVVVVVVVVVVLVVFVFVVVVVAVDFEDCYHEIIGNITVASQQFMKFTKLSHHDDVWTITRYLGVPWNELVSGSI